MIRHIDLTRPELSEKLKSGEIRLGGNIKLKIYGTLDCRSGKKMAVANRVFFASEAEALAHGFRPCGHCLRDKYRQWKANSR
jgi:metal binding Ada-like protein